MYAVVRRYTLKPGGVRELAARVEKEFVPILKSVPGFVSYTYLEGGQEWGRDVLTTVSMFTNREGAEDSVRRAAKWVGENLSGYEPSQPTVTAGEVLITTLSAAPSAAFTPI